DYYCYSRDTSGYHGLF
nr:immunoglobulin light chain junction region [Macaca mulatta]